MEKSQRAKELERLIKKYQKSYYDGEAEIGDAEFDALWDELKSICPESAVLKKVGADSGNFEKARHVMPMGSQEKAATAEEFLEWAKRHEYDEYLVERKMDGASLELQYSHGSLVRAVTRGDGSVGDDITANALKMRGVVKSLADSSGKPVDFTGGVRGEVMMPRATRREKFPDKANCRNAANGLMKRKDGEGCENLVVITYDVWASEGEQPFGDEAGKIDWLGEMGFNVVSLEICASALDVVEYRARVMEERGNFDYDIDGLVVKERRVDHADAMRARPDRQIAFKFSLEEAETIVRGVEWSASGGTYTPVAVFDPVELAGTTVRRASLANPDTLRSLGVSIGCSAVVVKRGEIIPKIESVLREGTESVKFPEKCETCGTRLVDSGSRLFCPNKSCPKRVLHQLLKWVEAADIRDMGETLMRALFSSGAVRSISGIYSLGKETLAPFFLGDESMARDKESLGAAKVARSIQAHRRLPLPAFVAGFDIEGIGETNAQKLVDAGFDTVEKLLAARAEDFAAVKGFAETMAKSAVEGLAENAAEMRALVDGGVITIDRPSAGALAGKSFCFTGELSTMKRADAEGIVKKNGGSCKSSVTKDLSYLVTNDAASGSSKNARAAALGIPIISEEEFLRLARKG